MLALRNRETRKYYRNAFQHGLSSVAQAMKILGAPGVESDWELVKVDKATISALLPIEELPPLKGALELRVEALEREVFGQ